MKTLTLFAAALLLFALQSKGQMMKKLQSMSSNVDYHALMGQDTKTVMQELKLAAKDTIGKTTTSFFPDDPKTPLKTLKLTNGDVLGFKNDKLAKYLPAAKK